MRKHPVVWFYILAFGISWLGLLPGIFGAKGIAPFDNSYVQLLGILFSAGPTLAAIIVCYVIQSKTGVQDLLSGLIRWRVSPVWYIVAVLGPACLFIVGQVITRSMGPSVTPAPPHNDQLPLVIGVLLTFLVNTGEEIGWRGFALPRLQNRYNAFRATLIVGLLWGLWHLPLVFLTGNLMAQSPLFWMISIVSGAFIYTWLYNSTEGSILLVALFHTSENICGVLIPGVSPIAYALLNSFVAILLLAVLGRTNLSHRERVCAG